MHRGSGQNYIEEREDKTLDDVNVLLFLKSVEHRSSRDA